MPFPYEFKDINQMDKMQTARPERGMTVGELLDHRIHMTRRMLDGLKDLKATLPDDYLNSDASRITAFIAL